MTTKPKAGLLPLYIKLYDEVIPFARPKLEAFAADVATKLAARGIEVVQAPVSCVAAEFGAAIGKLEAANVDMLVTLHLAYSPSGESVDLLAKTKLPIVMFDTTPDAVFGRDVDPDRILYNHGIHGVQDLACMLRRKGKAYDVVAGHYADVSVTERVADAVRAAHAAAKFRNTRAVRIGNPFKGMGDFTLETQRLESLLGNKVLQIQPADFGDDVKAITEAAIAEEMAADRQRYLVEAGEDVHRRSVRVGLGLRRYLDRNGIGAFSANFESFNSAEGPVDTVPFLEASKAMARGIGYAGEGDILTAAMVGALLSIFPKTTFTEMFCPDWRGDSVFLSHMGEISPAVIAGKALMSEKDFKFGGARNPAVITGSMVEGPAVLVNAAPGPGDSISLLVAPVDVLGDSTLVAMRGTVRGWIRSRLPVAQFLEEYSRNGGTHHSALVLGNNASTIERLGRMMGFGVVRIG